MRTSNLARIKPVHPHAWLWEPLETEASLVVRAMFGTKAVYLEGKLVLCFTAKAEPWRGVLVCTERRHHESLQAEFPALSPHPVLPKWLYLAEAENDFEKTATRLVRAVRQRDARIGVTPQPGRRARPRPRTVHA